MTPPTPADMPQQAPRGDWFDMSRNYPFGSRDYWRKRAMRRQRLIDYRQRRLSEGGHCDH